MIRISLADEQRPVRRCIAARLNGIEGLEVAREANSGEGARKEVREHDYDVLLMDAGDGRDRGNATPDCRG